MNQEVINQANIFANEATKVVFEPAYGAKYKAIYEAVAKRKYVVIRETDRQVDYGHGKGWEFYGRDSVVCMIDGETGDVFKLEGYNQPAKTKRYNIMTEDGLNQMIVNFQYGGNNGGFMYQDFKNIKIERMVA
jgi:hypothetical protein